MPARAGIPRKPEASQQDHVTPYVHVLWDCEVIVFFSLPPELRMVGVLMEGGLERVV